MCALFQQVFCAGSAGSRLFGSALKSSTDVQTRRKESKEVPKEHDKEKKIVVKRKDRGMQLDYVHGQISALQVATRGKTKRSALTKMGAIKLCLMNVLSSSHDFTTTL